MGMKIKAVERIPFIAEPGDTGYLIDAAPSPYLKAGTK